MSFVYITQQSTTTVHSNVALLPVQQTLFSMALLTSNATAHTTESWLQATADALSPAERQTNQLIFGGFPTILTDARDAKSFPAYLEALLQLEATAVVQNRTQSSQPPEGTDTVYTPSLLTDPTQLRQQVVDHLRMLWERHFAKEWDAKQSMMSYIAGELNGRDWPDSSVGALLRAFLRRPVPEWLAGQLGGVTQVVFVPSPYLHFQATKVDSTLYIYLWADFWIWPMRTEPIQRTEVLRAISALDDETRLQILEMLAASEALLAQEIIARLDVSQSTVSRHLKQLVTVGLVREERTDSANKLYRLKRDRIGEITHSLTQLLSEENAQLVLTDVRLQQPAELRPFLDRDGLVTTWPSKRKGQEAVLDYLITKFTLGERHSEAAVNALLNEWHTYDDPAYLRRSLIDMGLLQRTSDGAQYWREREKIARQSIAG